MRFLIIFLTCLILTCPVQAVSFWPVGGYYTATGEPLELDQVERWQAMDLFLSAEARPDDWYLNGERVRVWYTDVYEIDLPGLNNFPDALLIFGQTDRPDLMLVTVAYRHLGWHCLNAYFIDRAEWERITPHA